MSKARRGILNKEMFLEGIFKLGLQIGLVLIGLAFLFVAAIYYGIINP